MSTKPGILVCQRRASSLWVFAVECSANYTYSRVAHASESYSYLIDRAARALRLLSLVQRSRQHNFTMARHRRGARRRVLAAAVVVAGANALQRTQPPRRRTVRFNDAAPEAEAVEEAVVEAPVEPQMVAAPVETPEERAARDEDGPLKEFDWDAHLARIEADDEQARAAAAEEERQALAGGDEWLGDDLEQLTPQPVVDDEPEFLKPRWDEVDPADVDFRNPPASRGATWSRIHIKSDWWQFEDGERLKTEEGWERFDHRGYRVPEGLFEPTLEFTYGKLDLDVVERIRPAMDILSGCSLLEAADGIVRIKYMGPARNRVGVEAYATGLVGDLYPEMTSLTFEARFVSDYLDGSSAHAMDGWRQ